MIELKESDLTSWLNLLFKLRWRRYTDFLELSNQNLKLNKWSIFENLLLCYYYEKKGKRVKLAKKYFRVAERQFLYNLHIKKHY